jgi:hypothetical protein
MTDDPIEEIQPAIDRAFAGAPAGLKEAAEEWVRAILTSHTKGTIASSSGTRHLIGPPFSKLHAGRISTLCGMGLYPDEGPFAAVGHCAFCQEEAARDARWEAATAFDELAEEPPH